MPTNTIQNVTGQSLIAFDEFGPIKASQKNDKRFSAAASGAVTIKVKKKE